MFSVRSFDLEWRARVNNGNASSGPATLDESGKKQVTPTPSTVSTAFRPELLTSACLTTAKIDKNKCNSVLKLAVL